MFAFQCSLFKSLLKTLLYIFFFHWCSQTCLYGDFSESDLEWEPKLLTCSQEVYLIEPLINLFVSYLTISQFFYFFIFFIGVFKAWWWIRLGIVRLPTNQSKKKSTQEVHCRFLCSPCPAGRQTSGQIVDKLQARQVSGPGWKKLL